MANVQFTTVSTDREVQQILDLQAANHISSQTPELIESQGFVTVRHDPDVLLAMNRARPSVIAKDGDKLAGYCLVMPREFRDRVPILQPMFDMLDGLHWHGKSLRDLRWFVMGQVCVAEGYRGQGVFDGMYRHLREVCRGDFDFVVTEISARNPRSLAAHRRVGFEDLHVFSDPVAGELWHIVALDF